jgi:uncharacterized membrane protein YccC
MPAPPPPSIVRRTVRDTVRIDRSLLAPVAGALTAVPVALVYGLGVARWTPGSTSSLALGALFVGLAARLNGPRLAPSAMVADAVGLAVSAVVAGLTAGSLWLHVGTLAAWCFAGGLMVALGPGRSVIGVHGVMALIVFGRAPRSVTESCAMGLLVLVGGLAQTGIQVAVRVPIGLRPQRRATAEVFRALASGYRDSTGTWSAATARAVDAAARSLRPAALVVRRDAEALRGMVDEARRVRLELITIEELSRRLPDDPATRAAVDELRHLIDRLLRGLADALVAPRDDEPRGQGRLSVADIRAASGALEAAVAGEHGGHGPDAASAAVVGHFLSLRGQLRAAIRLVGPATDRSAGPVVPNLARVRLGGPSRPRPLAALVAVAEVLSEHLTPVSPAFRHAVRLAVVVPLLAVVGQHLGLGRSYWIPLSAAVVLRPDFAATMTRGLARVVGSVVGVGAMGVALAVLHPGPAAATVLVAATAWGAFATVQSNYAVGVSFLTGLVLLLASVGQPDTLGIAGDRLLDTVIGGSAALAAYVLWPTWSRVQARQLLARLAACQQAYAGAVLAGVTGAGAAGPPPAPSGGTVPDLRTLARNTRLAYTDAQAAVARSLAEPPSKRIDPDLGPGLLAALRRVTRALHGLRTEPHADGAMAGGADLASAVDAALRRISDALASDLAIGGLPPLRTLYHRVEDACADVPERAGVVIHLDELVNAVDTAAELVAEAGTGTPD